MSQVATGTMTSFGHAPYKDDEKNQPSFYVELEQANGAKSKFWSLGLEEALNKNNIKMGDNIALNDKGLIDGTKKREWEVEKYEPLIEHKNTIANTAAKQLGLGISTGEKESSVVAQGNFKKDSFKDELDLPEAVKNNYVALVKNRLFKDEKINFYDKGDTASIAFEDRNTTLNTSRQDEKTVKAMLDIAQAKSWTSISLKGTEEFKKQAWLEASVRGIQTKGYEPTEKDIAELKIAQQERTNNKIEHVETTLKQEVTVDDKDVKSEVTTEEIVDAHQEKTQTATNQDLYIFNPDIDQSSLSLVPEKESNPEIGTDNADQDLNVEHEISQEPDQDKVEKYNKAVADLKIDVAHVREYLAYADKLIDQASIGQSKIATDKGEISQADRLKLIEPEFRAIVQQSSMADYIKQGYVEDMVTKIRNLDQLVTYVENKKLNGVYEEDYKIHFEKYSAAYDNNKAINAVEKAWNENLGIGVLEKGNIKRKDLKENIENEKMVSLINTYRDELPDQEMGVTKHTGLAQLQVTLDTYKDKLAQKDLIAVEAYSSIIHEKFKDNPPKLEEKLNALSAKIPDIANGKYQLPEPPTIKHQADISISMGKQGEQDRGR